MWRPLIVCGLLAVVNASPTNVDRYGAASKYDELLTLRKIAKTQSETIKIQVRTIELQKEIIKMLRHTPCDGKTQIASFQKGT